MLDPASWEDKNDSLIVEEYRLRKGVSKVFALCFSGGDETIHHWKTYSDGISGCLIEFDGLQLIKSINAVQGIRFGPVKYRTLREVEKNKIEEDQIPFTKRWQYRCEEEWRIIWEGDTDAQFQRIPIDLKMINKITINQRMPDQVYDTIRDHLKSSFPNPEKKIYRSTLFENQRWISQFKRA
jgi:hypothetical protein